MSTIINIIEKLKQSKNLLNKAKPLPDTAKDVYGDVTALNKKPEFNEIKDSRNQNGNSGSNSVPDELPESSHKLAKELYEDYSLSKQESTKMSASSPYENMSIVNKSEHDLSSDSPAEPKSIDDEVKVIPQKASLSNQEVALMKTSQEEGFFNDFEKFLKNKEMDDTLVAELLSKDLLHKMKQFHVQQKEGKPFFFRKEDTKEAINAKLNELKSLEEEWFVLHKNLEGYQDKLIRKEAEIDDRLEDLKHVLKHIKQKEKLETKASKDSFFLLNDGRKVHSIGELRECLKNMNDHVFLHHVTDTRHDFADWILHVFHEKDLSDDVRNCHTRESLLDFLYSF